MKEKFKIKLKWFLSSFIWLGILFLIMDIVSKNVVVSAYKNGSLTGDGAILIPNFLRVQYIVNNHFTGRTTFLMPPFESIEIHGWISMFVLLFVVLVTE